MQALGTANTQFKQLQGSFGKVSMHFCANFAISQPKNTQDKKNKTTTAMFVYKWFTSLGNKKEQQEDVDALTKVAAPTNNNNTTSDLPSPVSTKPTPVVTPAVAPQPSVVAKPTPQPEPQEPSTPKKVEVEVKLTVPDKTPKSEKLSVAQLFASYVTLDSPDDLPDDPPGKKLGMNVCIINLISCVALFTPNPLLLCTGYYEIRC